MKKEKSKEDNDGCENKEEDAEVEVGRWRILLYTTHRESDVASSTQVPFFPPSSPPP